VGQFQPAEQYVALRDDAFPLGCFPGTDLFPSRRLFLVNLGQVFSTPRISG
jgi:hypothetical protein